MPSLNRIKPYVENGYYHIYNRGVNRQVIFFESADYTMFLHLVKIYLSSPRTVHEYFESLKLPFKPLFENFYQQLTIVSFCLMPNHFHLLVKQKDAKTITHFMRALISKYVHFINKKYNRVGSLFQGTYKGVLITQDYYLLHLSRYIHLNPSELNPKDVPSEKPWSTYKDYPYSSYSWYLRNTITEWFNPTIVLNFFNRRNVLTPKNSPSYRSFVEDYEEVLPEDLNALILE